MINVNKSQFHGSCSRERFFVHKVLSLFMGNKPQRLNTLIVALPLTPCVHDRKKRMQCLTQS